VLAYACPWREDLGITASKSPIFYDAISLRNFENQDQKAVDLTPFLMQFVPYCSAWNSGGCMLASTFSVDLGNIEHIPEAYKGVRGSL
jgi:hypothetical protein